MQYLLFNNNTNYNSCDSDDNQDFFFTSDNNKHAYIWIKNWPDFYIKNNINFGFNNSLLLYGNKNSGKSHLSKIWQNINNATTLHWQDVKNRNPRYIIKPNSYYVIEDIDNIQNEEKIMHIMNIVNELNSYLLFTSKKSIPEMQLKLPDLISRLNSIPVIELPYPDENSIIEIIKYKLKCKQLKLDDDLILLIINLFDYHNTNIDNIIKNIDYLSLQYSSNINRTFIKNHINEIISKDISSNIT